jgi:hypothetical protein
MTYEEFYKIVKEYHLGTSFSAGVYYMGKRIGYFDFVPCAGGHDYHFVPPKDDPDRNGYDLFNKEKDFRDYLNRKTLWFKKIKEEYKLENIKEDFK